MLWLLLPLASAGDLIVQAPPDAQVYVNRNATENRRGGNLARGLPGGMHEVEIRVGRRLVDHLRIEVPHDARVRLAWTPSQVGSGFTVWAPEYRPVPAPPPPPEPMRPPPGPQPMAPPDFSSLLRQVRDSSFDSGKRSLVELAAAHNFFLAQQTAALLREFSFDSNRAEVACMLAQRTLDPQNAHEVASVFTFDSHRNNALACFR